MPGPHFRKGDKLVVIRDLPNDQLSIGDRLRVRSESTKWGLTVGVRTGPPTVRSIVIIRYQNGQPTVRKR